MARRNILVNLGITAEIYITDADETVYDNAKFSPGEIVTGLSQRKARKAAGEINDPSVMIIAADTVVIYNGCVIGKPSDEQDAINTLLMLAGKFHEVYSGITIVFDNKIICDYDVTKVKFRDIDIKEIEQYVKTGDPLTKAGSYGAEGIGSAFMEHIEGDFFNIAGLPVYKFANILKNDFNMTVFDLI
ncbi:MAG: Maf family protein [Oscillospiraceae bacterium]|nr:Maf family protein [Oscillospiraceae bacterium]